MLRELLPYSPPILLGTLCILVAEVRFNEAEARRNYVEVAATITEVIPQPKGIPDRSMRRWNSSPDGWYARAEISYVYRVNGRLFEGQDRLASAVEFSSRLNAEDVARQTWPVDRQVTAAIDSEHPERSFLLGSADAGKTSGITSALFIAGTLFVVIGIVLMLRGTPATIPRKNRSSWATDEEWEYYFRKGHLEGRLPPGGSMIR